MWVPPRLMVITDTTVAPGELLLERVEAVLALSRPGSVVVQLRDPQLAVRERLRLGERLAGACRRHAQRFIVGDRCDLAVLLEADGVHLGERSVPAADARALVGSGAWITRASHDAGWTPEPDVDAVVLSPIMAERKGRPALGLDGIRLARRALNEAPRPVHLYALGGVDAGSAARCVEAGADGVAVIGAVLAGRAVEPLLRVLGVER